MDGGACPCHGKFQESVQETFMDRLQFKGLQRVRYVSRYVVDLTERLHIHTQVASRTNINFSWLQRLDVPDQGAGKAGFLANVLFLVYRRPSSYCVPTCQKESKLALCSLSFL